MHSVSHRVCEKILKSHLATFNFATQGLLNFDIYLGIRNLLTTGCS